MHEDLPQGRHASGIHLFCYVHEGEECRLIITHGFFGKILFQESNLPDIIAFMLC